MYRTNIVWKISLSEVTILWSFLCLEKHQQNQQNKINRTKSQFGVGKLKLLRYQISSKRIAPSNIKVQDIVNVKSSQRNLNYKRFLSNFFPHLSQKKFFFKKLYSNKINWQWSQNKEKTFYPLKQLVTSLPVLKFFNPNKEVILPMYV